MSAIASKTSQGTTVTTRVRRGLPFGEVALTLLDHVGVSRYELRAIKEAISDLRYGRPGSYRKERNYPHNREAEM